MKLLAQSDPPSAGAGSVHGKAPCAAQRGSQFQRQNTYRFADQLSVSSLYICFSEKVGSHKYVA